MVQAGFSPSLPYVTIQRDRSPVKPNQNIKELQLHRIYGGLTKLLKPSVGYSRRMEQNNLEASRGLLCFALLCFV
jgi:hypothetical protein